MTSRANRIARTVISQFEQLPSKRKPCVRDNGLHEWVPLSGIVAERDGHLTCLALATGMKCLPASKLAEANGVAIHDWHAEVLAIRTFNRFLLDECQRIVEGHDDDSNAILRPNDSADAGGGHGTGHHVDYSTIIQRNDSVDADGGHGARPFAIKDDVKLHMYCSEAPCGDASMELIMAAQQDATPWEVPSSAAASTRPAPSAPESTLLPPSTPASMEAIMAEQDASPSEVPPSAAASTHPTPSEPSALPGRAYFSQLGIVRRKPARGDAPPTLSKSCSDKIALKQCTSLLSSVASLLVNPANAHIDTLVLPESQYSAVACERAFSAAGRMKPVAGKQWAEGYAFRPFKVEATTVEFGFSKRAVKARSNLVSASNLAATWSVSGFEETILGGVLQGRRQFDIRGASKTSRRQMWIKARQVSDALASTSGGHSGVQEYLSSAGSYQDVKDGPLLAERRHVKAQVRQLALKGWVQNQGDSGFQI